MWVPIWSPSLRHFYKGQSIKSWTFDITPKLMFLFLCNLAHTWHNQFDGTGLASCVRIMTSHNVMSHNAQSFWTSLAPKKQGAYIKIKFYKGTAIINILKTLQKVCGGQALSSTAVYRWIDFIKHGRDSVESRYRPSRPVEARDEENVRKVKQILDTDRHVMS